MTTLLYADPHFFHAGIIRLAGRPFADVREMNDTLRMSWNAVVKPTDEVIVLGDFAHRAGDPKALRVLFDSLAGRKHLVLGNHDGPATRALPWASIHEALHTSIDSTAVTLCHYAWRTWPRIHRGALMLFGHHHGRLPGNSQSCDVGVDVFGWAPVRLNRIKAHLATLLPLADPESDPEPDNSNEGVKP